MTLPNLSTIIVVMKKHCLVVAGEQSGEEHALSFFDGLRERHPDIQFWGVGGDKLQEKGLRLLYHTKEFSSVGLWEVFGKILFYLKALKKIEQEVEKTQTRVAILIDFQDFNMQLAKRLKSFDVCVLYFVAPQLWLWRSYRIRPLKEYVHVLFTILPFEKDWFHKRGIQHVVSVVHPLYRRYKDTLPTIKKRGPLPFRMALCPGSRNEHVHQALPLYLKALDQLRSQGYHFKTTIICSSNVREDIYSPYLDRVDFVAHDDELEKVLQTSDYAFSGCGTVSLACALFGVLTVVSQRGSLMTEFFVSHFLRYYKGHLCLANIFAQKEVFPVFLLKEKATAYNIGEALKFWVDHPLDDQIQREGLLKIRSNILGDMGSVVETMSALIEKNATTC